ncbi:MAG: tetratricopeptide repeat protein, partial [Saprospiraceae bacterium]
MKFKFLLIAFLYLCCARLIAQDSKFFSTKGDRLYKDSNYTDAEESYRKANDLKPEFKNKYNIANSLYQQGRTKEAGDYYEKSLQEAESDKAKSKAFYNLGNAYFEQKNYEKSIQ